MRASRPFLAALSIAALAFPSSALPPGARDNILVILADDLGVDKVGVYQPGTTPPPPQTPNLDALAAGGIRFRNAYALPICSPSRAAFQTGRYGFRNGIGSNVSGANELPVGPLILPGLLPTTSPVVPRSGSLSLEEILIPEMLDRAGTGYAHATIGKWHLGRVDAMGVPGHAASPGYGHFSGTRANFPTEVAPHPDEDYFFWTRVRNGESQYTTEYNTFHLVDEALSWIGEQGDEPWFCFVSFSSAHSPFHRPPGFPLPNRKPQPGEAVWPYFNAMVACLDAEVGRLLAGIGAQDPEVFADTTVLFMGDNGTSSKPGPKQLVFPPFAPGRAKGTVYEGGIHVPLIASGKRVNGSGRVSDALVGIVDLFATIAEIAGVDLRDPAVIPPTTTLDSISFLPVLATPGHPGDRGLLFAEVFASNNAPGVVPGDRSIRDRRYKLIRFEAGLPAPVFELYDLQLDPHETSELLGQPGGPSKEQALAFTQLNQALVGLLGGG